MCKLTACKNKIEKGDIRVGKSYPSDRFTEGGVQTDYFHAPCIFQSFKRARKTTKRIEKESDLEGFAELSPEDQDRMREMISVSSSGGDLSLPSQGEMNASQSTAAQKKTKPKGASKKKVAAGASGDESASSSQGSSRSKATGKAKPILEFAHEASGSLTGEGKKGVKRKQDDIKAANNKPQQSSSSSRKSKGPKTVEVFRARLLRPGGSDPIYLTDEVTYLGRGPVTGITDKRCSRKQVELRISDKQVKLTVLGTNALNMVERANGEKEPALQGQPVALGNNDKFTVFLDDPYTLQTRVDTVQKPDDAEDDAAESSGTEEDEALIEEAAQQERQPGTNASTSEEADAIAMASTPSMSSSSMSLSSGASSPSRPSTKRARKVEVKTSKNTDEGDDQSMHSAGSYQSKSTSSSASNAKSELPSTPKKTAAPRKPRKTKKSQLSGEINSDDDGQPNTYDLDDGFVVANEVEDDPITSYSDDDVETIREAQRFLGTGRGRGGGGRGGIRNVYLEEEEREDPSDTRPACKYGAGCYRVNPDHLRQFYHPLKEGGGRKPSGSPSRPQKKSPSKAAGGRQEATDVEDERRAKEFDIDTKAGVIMKMSQFKDLEPEVVRAVLEGHDGSMNQTLLALKEIVSAK